MYAENGHMIKNAVAYGILQTRLCAGSANGYTALSKNRVPTTYYL